MVGDVLGDFRENLDNEFGFESTSVIHHYHGDTSLEEMEHAILVVLGTKIERNPMSIELIHRIGLDTFVEEGLNRDVVVGAEC